jgi:hypothetical protein
MAWYAICRAFFYDIIGLYDRIATGEVMRLVGDFEANLSAKTLCVS